MSSRPPPALLKYDVPVLEGSQRSLPPRKKMSSDEHLMREVLDEMLPPRKFTEDGQTLVQYVSISPATRSEVIKLQTQLDSLLTQRKARNTGICPIRSELYAQCFDEIIRQVTITCSARGRLLVKVRDELRMTESSYHRLYESAVAWGMRKVILVEQQKAAIEEENSELKERNRTLTEHVRELQEKIAYLEKHSVERRNAKDQEYAEQIAILKRQNAQAKLQLDNVLSNR